MVLNANVENLPTTSDGCPGDWRDLFYYLELQPNKPDIVFLQQVTDIAQLQQIVGYMTLRLGRVYSGVIAENDPTPFNSPCGAQKARQTNAIVWATDRLTPASAPSTWQSWKRNADGVCVRDALSRTRSIAMALLDLQANEQISAASIHWSTRNGPGSDPACAQANATETDQKLRTLHPDAATLIFGGDKNEPDLSDHSTSGTFLPWYVSMNTSLGGTVGFVDPIYETCSGVRSCLLSDWTFRANNGNRRRIDFLFAARPGGGLEILNAHTITFNQANAADLEVTGSDNPIGYSDHRAVYTRVRY